MTTTLIVVDVQVDFCEGGALPVKGGHTVAHDVARYIKQTTDYYDQVLFTRDWHKPLPDTNGGHFGDPPDYVDSWPVHCVADTFGAEFHPALDGLVQRESIFSKGHGFPHYSGFQGKNEHGLYVNDYLESTETSDVHVVGLAADYCVKQTALDAVRKGYSTLILPDLTASIHEFGTMEAIREVVTLERELR